MEIFLDKTTIYNFNNNIIECLQQWFLVLATKIIQVHQNSGSQKVNNNTDVVLTLIRELPTLLISPARLGNQSNLVNYNPAKNNNMIRKTAGLIMSLIIRIKSIHHTEGFANQHHISRIQ